MSCLLSAGVALIVLSKSMQYATLGDPMRCKNKSYVIIYVVMCTKYCFNLDWCQY